MLKRGKVWLKNLLHGLLHGSARRMEACLSGSRSLTIAAECGVRLSRAASGRGSAYWRRFGIASARVGVRYSIITRHASFIRRQHCLLPTCCPCKQREMRGRHSVNGAADCRLCEAEGANNLRLSPPGVVPMQIDYGGLMWSCRIGRHRSSRSAFGRAALRQEVGLMRWLWLYHGPTRPC
jgi:hypothetical protein